MNTNRKTRRLSVAAILLIAAVSVMLSACVGNITINDEIFDKIQQISQTSEESTVSVIEDDSAAPGQTKRPTVDTIVNITPSMVCVSGRCEDNATIAIAGGGNTVEVLANGGYYIAEVSLGGTKTTVFEVTAVADGKEKSNTLTFSADYNATAQARLDGNSVSVGNNSRLYLDSFVDDFTGANLYTVSELKNIRQNVTNNFSSFKNRAAGADVEMIYVLVPNVTTIYPEIFPETVEMVAGTTRYSQIIETLSKTGVRVIDMKPILEAEKAKTEDIGKLYRVTDSTWTEYSSMLAYAELMKIISETDTDGVTHTQDDFTEITVDSLGGRFIGYRDLDNSIIKENVTVYKPKFSLDMGDYDGGTAKLKDIKTYLADDNRTLFTTIDTNDGISGACERLLIKTNRESLPNALVYRDESGATLVPAIADRFNVTMFGKAGDFTINLSNAVQYSAEGKKVVDYIVVFVSENNIAKAFDFSEG